MNPQYPTNFIEELVATTRKRVFSQNTESFEMSSVVRSFDDILPLGEISDLDWQCPICLGLPRIPASLKCGHIFCEKCIRQVIVRSKTALQGQANCPNCRSVFKNTDILEYNKWPLVCRAVWKMLRIMCKNKGCEFVGSPEAVSEHEAETCDRRETSCPATFCSYRGVREETALHAATCRFLYIYCIGCGYPIKYLKREQHSCSRVHNAHLTKLIAPCENELKGKVSMHEVHVDDELPGEGCPLEISSNEDENEDEDEPEVEAESENEGEDDADYYSYSEPHSPTSSTETAPLQFSNVESWPTLSESHTREQNPTETMPIVVGQYVTVATDLEESETSANVEQPEPAQVEPSPSAEHAEAAPNVMDRVEEIQVEPWSNVTLSTISRRRPREQSEEMGFEPARLLRRTIRGLFRM